VAASPRSAGRWISAVGVLAGTVLLHEVAHAIAARRAGGEVREIAVGFGPRIARARIASTDVSLRAVPVGGFAAIDVDKLPPRRRIAVLLAGPVANIVVGTALRRIAGRAPATPLPGQSRTVEVGGLISAIAVLRGAASGGARTLLRAAGDLNISIGLANLLPLLPLDGGHIASARMEVAGARRPAIAAFRQISTAIFLWFALRVLVADLARMRRRGG
jgi:membrane-associated protease RseP (regulator of RpoE activity)